MQRRNRDLLVLSVISSVSAFSVRAVHRPFLRAASAALSFRRHTVLWSSPHRAPVVPHGWQHKRRLTMSGGAESVQPMDVLEFWFGEEFREGNLAAMETMEYRAIYQKRWFMGTPDFDKECFDKFAEVIRAASNNGMSTGKWDEPNGRLARVILFDQLTRNAFRKQPEAFHYDDEALAISRRILADGMLKHYTSFGIQFAVMPLLHSEVLDDHEKLDAVLSTEYAGNEHLAKQLVSLREHTAVLRLFGRYPHRNALFGREETPEEAEWCKRDDIPGWAKSQIKKA